MKKIFSTVAALGLVAGMATAASALDFSVTGKYTVEGYYITEMLHGASTTTLGNAMPFSNSSAENGSDAFFIQYLWMFPELKINDKTKVKSEVRISDESIWGNQGGGDAETMTGNTGRLAGNATQDLDIHKLWMEWDSPSGKVSVGRQSTGYGTPFLNNYRGHADRIIWATNFLADPWTLKLMYEKTTEGEAFRASEDEDSDMYEIAFGSKAEGSKFEVAYDHIVNMTGATSSQVRERVRAWADMAFSNYFVQYEFSYDFGDWINYDNPATQDQDLNSLAAFIAAGGKFNDLTAYLAYVYASGQDPNDGNKTDAIFGPAGFGFGSPFQPLYIWTGGTTGLYNDYVAPGYEVFLRAGVHVFGLFGDYALNDKVSLHGAVAYALAGQENYIQNALVLPNDLDNELGWEFDLGAGYKILDNLKYEIHLGWWMPGGLVDDIVTQKGATWSSNDIYLVSNHLTLSF